jgi:predicted ferric reductase
MMCATSISLFRARLYEVFYTIHFGCSITICASLWLHISTAERIPKIQAILGASVWGLTQAHRSLLVIYRNFSISQPRTSVVIHNIHNSLRLEITSPRPWKVKPGQYVYLTMARPGLLSIFQRHPFMIAGCEDNESVELRIQPRSGFTRRLLISTLGEATHLSGLIEGPYGRGFDLREFGTVVLFASGIGIAGHLPYLRELVQDYQRSTTKTRDLLLIWYVESPDQRNLVADFMDGLLRRDKPSIQLNPYEEHLSQDGKAKRRLEVSSTPDRPGIRPAPHGGNVSITNRNQS